MDREQEEMQFLGLFDIYQEAYKVIFTWRKIFSKITLALILPLSFIFLAHMQVSHIVAMKIIHNEIDLDHTKAGTPKYEKLSDLLSSEWAFYWLIKAVYLTFYLIFSLLSTAAVVYTIACIYTGRELSFRKIMSVVPVVWKRLMVTFLCTFVVFFAYNIATFLIFVLWLFTLASTNSGLGFFFVWLVAYFVGFLYLTIIWHLASVVSVLEDSCGVKAMVKSKALIKGKMAVAIIIFLKLIVSLVIIQVAFQKLVVNGSSLGMPHRVSFGILCFLLLCKLILFSLVIQTVIYFVCKSYHHESIDKSALSDHLEVYLGEYVPLKAKDVQLEQFQV